MAIIGIGTDIIEIERVKGSIEKVGFFEKIFTEKERSTFNGKNHNSFAGYFAAKEAVSKALGTGFAGIAPNEIEVCRNEKGAPYILLYGKALSRFEEIGGKSIFISISHSKDNTVAFCVIEG